MTSVRALARRRQAKRKRHAAAVRRAFYERGERAWHQYLRDGQARPLDDVFDGIDARVDARRRRLVGLGEWLGRRATTVTFPPGPEPLPWDHPEVLNPRPPADELDDLVSRITPENKHPPLLDDWEPPRLELEVQSADLSDEPAPPPVYADINPPRTTLSKLRTKLEKKKPSI